MKLNLLLSAIYIFMFSFSNAQEAPVPVLEETDIDQYVETAIPLLKEFKKFGIKMDKQDHTIDKQYVANKEAISILEKYGWDETFFVKMSVITYAYMFLKMKSEIAKLPETERTNAEQMIPMYQSYMTMVHEDDLKKVESKMPQLDGVFHDMEKL